MAKPYRVIYHVFADNCDEWFETRRAAEVAYAELRAEGHENRRIYKEVYDTKEAYENDILTDEYSIRRAGGWPL